MKIELKIGDNKIKKNGQDIELDVIPFLQDGRTFVPVRGPIAEMFGYNVEWSDAPEQTVAITDDIPTAKHTKYFATTDECAIDFAMCYTPLSIATNREISALITQDENGYFYTNVYLGVEDRCTIQAKGFKRVSDIHTHGSAGG